MTVCKSGSSSRARSRWYDAGALRCVAAVLSVLVALGVSSRVTLAQHTCGPGDPPGRIPKGPPQDLGGGKTFQLYCVNGLYFEGEICCGTVCTPFGKCVFDGGLNRKINFPGPGGRVDKIVWYNWDPACGVTLPDTKCRRGETAQQCADRVRQLLIDRRCEVNCYTWCRPNPLQPEDYIDQTVAIYRSGKLVAEYDILGREALSAYAGDDANLIEEEEMYDLNLVGQVYDESSSTKFVDVFEDGVLDTRITPSSEEFGLDVSGGSLNFNIVEHGDGFRIDAADLHPMCMVLDEMTLAPFNAGNGFGIMLEFSSGKDDWVDVQFYERSSAQVCEIMVKIVQKMGDITNELRRKVPGVKLNDVKSVQIDWVPSPGQIDRIEIEVMTRDGKIIRQTVRSGLSHTAGATTAYVIRGLDITYDPAVSIGAIHYSDEHTDYEPGVSHSLAVDSVTATVPATVRIGETVSMALATSATLFNTAVGIPGRELNIAQSADSTASVMFTSQAVFCAMDASEISILTSTEGTAVATFIPLTTGTVSFFLTTPDGEHEVSVPMNVTCAADWNLDGVVDSMDFFMFVEEFVQGEGDYNGDGVVHSADFFDFVMEFAVPVPCVP